MISKMIKSFAASVLFYSMAHGTPAKPPGPVHSLPPSASYVYTTPAMYLWLEVKQVAVLGNLSTGSTQLFGPIVDGQLISEPGFEPAFNGSVRNFNDFLTADPTDGIARPACIGEIAPNNGDTPFILRISGVDNSSATASEIFSSSTDLGLSVPYGYSYSIWTPTFYGGSPKYSVLQNSVFVASETVASSPRAGYFLVGMKISKIWPVNTTITIGHEFP